MAYMAYHQGEEKGKGEEKRGGGEKKKGANPPATVWSLRPPVTKGGKKKVFRSKGLYYIFLPILLYAQEKERWRKEKTRTCLPA